MRLAGQSLPERLWLDAIRDTDAGLEITGKSFDNEGIATFMEHLDTASGAPFSPAVLQNRRTARGIASRSGAQTDRYDERVSEIRGQSLVVEERFALPDNKMISEPAHLVAAPPR